MYPTQASLVIVCLWSCLMTVMATDLEDKVNLDAVDKRRGWGKRNGDETDMDKRRGWGKREMTEINEFPSSLDTEEVLESDNEFDKRGWGKRSDAVSLGASGDASWDGDNSGYLLGVEKRRGWGKRSDDGQMDKRRGWGKRSELDLEKRRGWGKRSDFDMEKRRGWGKRGDLDMDKRRGWGKRSFLDSSEMDKRRGWGKRASAAEDTEKRGWGKRSLPLTAALDESDLILEEQPTDVVCSQLKDTLRYYVTKAMQTEVRRQEYCIGSSVA
nr:RGWamide [Urechis unicinctus]